MDRYSPEARAAARELRLHLEAKLAAGAFLTDAEWLDVDGCAPAMQPGTVESSTESGDDDEQA